MLVNIVTPIHRQERVVNELYSRWGETINNQGRKPVSGFGKYFIEDEGMYGCFAAFCVNGVVYIDSELYGQFNSKDDLLLVAQVMELQTTWGNGNYAEALNKMISPMFSWIKHWQS